MSEATILERLRAGEPCCDDPCRVQEARSGCLCAAAADEIARLRGVIYRNCDPFDATPEDAVIINEVAAISSRKPE